uniref:EF-hand domain-containing protein n=1 Tax=Panagrellus redivivus TaxID=6233 RepID=A0A7E4VIJ4_PANRE
MRSGPRFVQLSEQFIDSLKAFFDSVDVERHGFVSFENICHRWQQFPPRLTDVLPFNFLDCLARTVPPNGLITFERFLAGVRIAIAEQRQGRRGEMKRVQSDGGTLYQPPCHYDDLDGDAEQVAANYAPRCPIMGTTSHNHHRQSVPAMSASSASESPAHFDYSESETPVQVSMRSRKQHRGPGAIFNNSQFRPISTSSSMAEIRWRDSRMSNNSTPLGDTNNNIAMSATAAGNNNRHSNYLPEHTPQVVSIFTRVLQRVLERGGFVVHFLPGSMIGLVIVGVLDTWLASSTVFYN